MADPNVKTVNVQVETGSTEHALLTGAKKTRRRRNANSSPPTPAPASVGGAAASVPSTMENATTAAVKVTKMTEGATAAALSPTSLSPQTSPASPAQAKPAALGPPQPPQAPPVTVPPPVLAPAPASAVKIAPKNGGGQAPPTPAPRLLPKKRIGTAPAAETLKAKPKFVVEAGAATTATEDSQKGGTFAADVPTSGTNRSAVGGARSRTRRAFKERRISLTVQPVKKSRKYRRTLRARVAEMPLQQVRRMLLRKGVLKPKKDTEKAPPEEMMRSMLVDYMMLHHAD